MSENILFVLHFIINSDKLINDSFFVSLFSSNGMGTKDCGSLKVAKDTCILQIQLNEGCETMPSKDPSD